MNMSYCRFENTFRDLEDCVDALVDNDDLSEREANFAHRMRNLCQQVHPHNPQDHGMYFQIYNMTYS